MANLTEDQKRNLVSKLIGPNAESSMSLAKKLGGNPSAASLNRWKKKYAGQLTEKKRRRPENWLQTEKIEAVMQTILMTEPQIDSFLDKRGISINDLNAWKVEILESSKPKAMVSDPAVIRENSMLRSQIKALNDELAAIKNELQATTNLLTAKLKPDKKLDDLSQ